VRLKSLLNERWSHMTAKFGKSLHHTWWRNVDTPTHTHTHTGCLDTKRERENARQKRR